MTDITETAGDGGLTAVLLQLAGLAGKLTAAEQRQEDQARDIGGRVAALARAVESIQAAVAGHDQALEGVGRQVAGLAGGPAGLAPDGGARPDSDGPGDGGDGEAGAEAGYRPSPQPRFWKPAGPDRDQAVARLRAWVEQVHRPGHGHLAAGLAECWDQHPLCLYILDWLSELWSVLYLAQDRTAGTLAGQAEWHARLLPAAAGLLARETRGCGHPGARHPATGYPAGRYPAPRPGARP